MAGQDERLSSKEQGWQAILDAAASFNSLCVPDPGRPSVGIGMAGNALAGADLRALGHRFEAVVEPPTLARGVRARNVVGPSQFDLDCRWLLIPDDFGVLPGRQPPPTAFEPRRSQRFGLWDATFDFGNGELATGIGAGRTFPLGIPGEPDRVAMIGGGAILEGSGGFAGLSGTFVLNGFLTPPDDFQLNVFLRMQDPDGKLLASSPPPPVRPARDPVDGTTYLPVRTASWPRTTNIRFTDGQPSGLETWEDITLFESGFTDSPQGTTSESEIGPSAGRHSVNTSFFGSPSSPGTATSPIPFIDTERFIFTDTAGRFVGSLTAPVMEGRSILVSVPGIPPELGAQIFCGFAQITAAEGCFAGASGTVTNVGIGTLDPHLTSILYIAQLADPSGRYRAG